MAEPDHGSTEPRPRTSRRGWTPTGRNLVSLQFAAMEQAMSSLKSQSSAFLSADQRQLQQHHHLHLHLHRLILRKDDLRCPLQPYSPATRPRPWPPPIAGSWWSWSTTTASSGATGPWKSTDIEGRSRAITRVQAGLTELTCALDLERGGEIARNLWRLYDFMGWALSQALVRRLDQGSRMCVGCFPTCARPGRSPRRRSAAASPPWSPDNPVRWPWWVRWTRRRNWW
jgi:hypothetical protein